jgi:hypothetical protein
MKAINKILVLGLAIITLASCQDKIDLDLPEGEKFLVVEGWITNEERDHTVKLTFTQQYFDSSEPAPASGAFVLVRDDEGAEVELEETAPGIYTYPGPGEVGRSYQLEILLQDGTRYLSDWELLREPVPIFSIEWRLSEDEPDPDNDENPDDIYEVIINTQEPAGLGDHYQWRSFLNGEEQRDPFDIFVTTDEFVDGNPIPEFNVTDELYSKPDTVRIIQERISRAAYEFYSELQSQTAFVGGPFDTPPAPLIGNVKDATDDKRYALGFFGAAGVDDATTIVGVE